MNAKARLSFLSLTLSIFTTLAALALTSLASPSVADAAVWTTTASWSQQTELNYQNWVRSTWTKTIFTNPGPLQDVKLDCADAVYTMRLLYAYENGLPFAVRDPSGRSVISNDMKRFDSLPSGDRRFRAFAEFIYDILGTGTLNQDSYPVAMNRSAVHSGVFLKTEKATHHSWTVHDIDRGGVPFLLFASRPAKTQLIDRHGYPSMGFLWGQQDANGQQMDNALQTPGDVANGAGFRMYRLPEDLKKPEWQVPGYSLEQFSMNRIAWGRSMQRALQLTQETTGELAERLLKEACQEATDRIASVYDSVKAMSSKSSSYCFNAQEYDDYSTPSRDSRAVAVFQDLSRVYKNSGSSLASSTRAKLEAILTNRDPGAYCPLRILKSQTITLGEAVTAGLQGKWSSNPNDSLLARWGKERSPTAHAASCPRY